MDKFLKKYLVKFLEKILGEVAETITKGISQVMLEGILGKIHEKSQNWFLSKPCKEFRKEFEEILAYMENSFKLSKVEFLGDFL